MLEQSQPITQGAALADVAVLVLDEAGCVLSSNGAAQQLLGLTDEELVSRFCLPSTTLEQGEGTDSLAAGVGSPLGVLALSDGAGGSVAVKGTCVTLDASLVGRAITLVILDQSRSVPPAIVTISGDSLSAVSQTVRMPLCAITGYLDVLLERHRLARRGELSRIVDTLRRNARWLEQLVDNLLSAVSLLAGRFIVEPRPICVVTLLEEATAMVETLTGGKRQSLVLALPQIGAAATVWADRQPILQVLVNLLSNALKHTPEGGHVTVAATEGRGYWQISVSDDNPGTPWWERDFVAANDLSADGPASRPEYTDLGIAVAKSIVEMHGGQMGLVSSPDRGSMIWLTLPSAPAGITGD